MEVHAHTHTARKKWTHYLWEFLMLFLAVFCGFLAENFREHQVENQREKKFVRMIYTDLKKDTAFYDNYKSYLIRGYYRLDSVANMLNTGEYQKKSDFFYSLCLRAWSSRYFTNYSTTFDQMKNSGNLRLIREDSLIYRLMDYYYKIERGVNNLEEFHQRKNDQMINAMLGFLDAGYYRGDSLIDGKGVFGFFTAPDATIGNPDPEKLKLFKSACLQKKLAIIGLNNSVVMLKSNAEKLIIQIRQSYHLK